MRRRRHSSAEAVIETTVDHPEWGEVDVRIEATVEPYDPGVCSGPVERCYPPEGGDVELLSIRLCTAKESEHNAQLVRDGVLAAERLGIQLGGGDPYKLLDDDEVIQLEQEAVERAEWDTEAISCDRVYDERRDEKIVKGR